MKNQYNIFNIRGTQALNELLKKDVKEINLYKINLKEDTKVIAFTNSTYYDNTNKTLPLGMNVEQAILLDNSLLHLKEIKDSKMNIVCYEEDNNELSKICIKEINIKEFKLENIE